LLRAIDSLIYVWSSARRKMLQLFQKAGDRGESNAIDKGLSCVRERKAERRCN
jgi:hypothetical protein